MSVLISNFKLNYIPARICDGKELLIKYYVRHPIDGQMKKKTIRFNHLRKKYSKTEIIRIMRAAVHQINIDLAAGKNPFIEAETPKSYEYLKDAVKLFLKIKSKDMRPDGMRSYNSFCSRLLSWMAEKKLENCYIISFTRKEAVDMMNELTLNDKISNRTWNNYFVFYRSLWNWFIENTYCKENVFGGFKKKREEKKKRILIDAKSHQKIVSYFRANKPEMEIIIELVRVAFIRPKEICHIRIKDIRLQEQVIHISPEVSKTHESRFAYLPEWLCLKISDICRLGNTNQNDYLFSTYLSPGTKKTDTRTIDKHWSKMRDVLKIPVNMQLYSYRDTGITKLLEDGVPANVIQKLTGHKTENMVGKYIHQPDKLLINDIVSKIPDRV